MPHHVIDAHVQLGVDHWLSTNQPTQIEGSQGWAHRHDLAGVERDRDALAAAGFALDGIVALPFPSAGPAGYRETNEALLRAAESSSLPILPIYAVNPFDPVEREWLGRVVDEGRPCGGVKLNPFLGRPGGYALTDLADDQDLVEVLASRDLRVAMHVGTGREHRTRPVFPQVAADPDTAVELARRLPHLRMLMLHVLRLSPTALASAADLENVFIDTSGLSSLGRITEGGDAVLLADEPPVPIAGPADAIRWMVDDLGLAPRLVFGSATPFAGWWQSSATADAEMLRDALAADHLDDVLAGNARRFAAPELA